MSGIAYICDLGGCDAQCRHGHVCGVWRSDAEHPHPAKHVGYDNDADEIHEWIGKGTGKCLITAGEAV